MTQNTYIFEKAQFEKFLEGELTVNEVKKMNLSNRFNYIVNKMAEILEFNFSWFDYDNQSRDRNGYFNVDTYDKNTYIVFENKTNTNKIGSGFSKYDDSFPTSWFYENFENKLQEEYNQFIEEQKLKQNEFLEKKKSDNQKYKEYLKTVEEFKSLNPELGKKLVVIPEDLFKIVLERNKVLEKKKEKEILTKNKKFKSAHSLEVSKEYQKYLEAETEKLNFAFWFEKNVDNLKKKFNYVEPEEVNVKKMKM